MKKERIALSFVAASIGLLVSGLIFFVYQTARTIPRTQRRVLITSPNPSPKPSIFLTVESPKHEEVVDRRLVSVLGKTTKDATVVLSLQSTDYVLTPSSSGDFSITVAIENGVNVIEILAIAPNGEEAKEVRTVAYSTESF